MQCDDKKISKPTAKSKDSSTKNTFNLAEEIADFEQAMRENWHSLHQNDAQQFKHAQDLSDEKVPKEQNAQAAPPTPHQLQLAHSQSAQALQEQDAVLRRNLQNTLTQAPLDHAFELEMPKLGKLHIQTSTQVASLSFSIHAEQSDTALWLAKQQPHLEKNLQKSLRHMGSISLMIG